ncbi:unnamed protein product [Rotaria socialis]|uniref:Uncharacterized protein n=2 Tax=Rotaria socialis TaxID=392032 RepID=A0A820IKX8_9BILA|nr:unnamed protein product [Rotaria socialis]CAF4313805.1 unnamed protein product [Rotaria socialis]
MSGSYSQNPSTPVIVAQPYAASTPSVVVINTVNKDVQHGCHFLLWLITGGLWTPCWIGACCGCCRCAFGIDTNMLTDTDNEYMCKAEILTGQSFESNPLSYLMPWLIPVLSYIIIGQTMWMQFLHKWKQTAEELPRIYSNITCNCAASDACQRLLRIGPSDLILPGLVVGCLPLDAYQNIRLRFAFNIALKDDELT